jgi:hypothetical protein
LSFEFLTLGFSVSNFFSLKGIFMSFTGKATYSGGSTLPEIADDVADLVSILAPAETALLEALGDSLYAATSTRHEWLEDALVPRLIESVFRAYSGVSRQGWLGGAILPRLEAES